MRIIKEKVEKKGVIRIPREMMENLQLKVGEEVELSIEGDVLIVRPKRVEKRKKLHIQAQVVDELIDKEEIFEPEWT